LILLCVLCDLCGESMRQYKRSHRVGDLIREILSEMLLRDLSDPRLETVTITEVEVTDDLKQARVFFSARGIQAREEAASQGLESAAGVMRKKLGREMRLRYIPELMFKVDHSFEYGSKIDRLIQTIKEEKSGDSQKDR
jgi:ribosome-binding factor A